MMSRVTGSTSRSGISAIRSSSSTGETGFPPWAPSCSVCTVAPFGGDQDVEVRVDGCLVAREDDRRRVELGDDRGALQGRSRLELRAVVDLRRHAPAVEDDLLLVDDRRGRVLRAEVADR